MSKIRIFVAVACGMFLAACDATLDDRTVNRAATGAAVGAVATVLTDGNILKGAVVGGAVGALTSKIRLGWD